MILATDLLMLVFAISAPLAVYLAWSLRDVDGGGGGEPPEGFDPWNPDPGGLELPSTDWDAELRALTAVELVRLVSLVKPRCFGAGAFAILWGSCRVCPALAEMVPQ